MAGLREIVTRPEIEVSEAPAPQRLAPYAVALTAEVVVSDIEQASGRLVLLHDPVGQEAWRGRWRVVVFSKGYIEPELIEEATLSDMGWAWLTEALRGQGVGIRELGGTVTRTYSQSYGALESRDVEGQLELRASWTPPDDPIPGHIRAWLSLLEAMAGLEPLPEGVTSLRR